MKRYLFNSLIVLLFLVASCGQDDQSRNGKTFEYTVNVHDSKKYDPHDVFKTVQYIELSSDGPILASVEQVLLTGKYIFIVDDMTNTLSKFSSSGNFLGRLDGDPEGPGNVAEITWISIDSTKQIVYIYSEPEGKLAAYDYDLHFIDKMPKSIFCHSIAFLGEGRFLVFSNDTKQSGLTHNFTVIDWNGEVLNEMIPIDSRFERVSYDMNSYISKGQNCLNAMLNLRYDIYCVDAIMADIKYSFDFGTATLRPDEVSGKSIGELIPVIKRGNKYILGSVLESEDYLYLEASNFSEASQIWIDKKSGITKVVAGFTSLDEMTGNPIGTFGDNKFVGILPSEVAGLIVQLQKSSPVDTLNPTLIEWANSTNPGALLTVFEPK